jgi:hypothetical protein
MIYDLTVLFWRRAGFWSAMASNLSNQSRNVLSKKVMVKKEVIYILQIQIFLIILFLFLDYYKIMPCDRLQLHEVGLS